MTGFVAAFTEGPIDFYKSQVQVQIIRSKGDPNYKRASLQLLLATAELSALMSQALPAASRAQDSDPHCGPEINAKTFEHQLLAISAMSTWES